MIGDETADPRDRFLASLNHEVRTPLSGILGMTDLLLETKLDAEQKEYVEAARLCAENLLELLNATLEYSALSSNCVALEDSEFGLRELLEAVAAEFEFKACTKGLRLVRDLSPDVPAMAVGDGLRLRQILSHLLTNAIKFTHRGFVELGASVEAAGAEQFFLQLRIADSGIGIPPDQLHSVFESFRQLDSGLSRRYNGLGLGLSLAQKIATLMNGELSAASSVGEGSTFTVRIPLRVSADSRFWRAEQTAAERRIMVVEDNAVARTISAHVLRGHGYAVDCVSSGEEALAAASQVLYDLVLMDLQMPGMDGFQTTAAIRALERYADVPIIALTANSSDDYRDACAREGLDGFLSKPIRPKELAAAVERHMNRKRMPVSIAAGPNFNKIAHVS